MVRGGRRLGCPECVTIAVMDGSWWVGVLPAGVENVQTVAAGEETSREAAIDAAVDALVVVALDRGRQEYRLTVADTQMIIFPGLTIHGRIDVEALQDTRYQLERCSSPNTPAASFNSHDLRSAGAGGADAGHPGPGP